MSALGDLRVVELGEGLPVAYCGRQFALWGADVVVLEPEGGSPLRRRAPRVGSRGGSLLWAHVAAGKRSVARPDASGLRDLLSRADVLLADAGRLEALGLTAVEVRRERPQLVIVEFSPFGADGPLAGRPAAELTVQAASGYLHLNGEPGRAPLKAPGHILAYACGVSAFVAALAGVVKRLKRRSGSLIEASELEALASIVPLLRGQYTGVHPVRTGGPGTGVRLMPCADGYVSFMPPTTKQLGEFEQALGVAPDSWPASARNGRAKGRAPELMSFLAPFIEGRPAEAVFMALLRAGIPCGLAQTPADLLDEPHLHARGFFQALEDPALGSLKMPGAPARLSRTPPRPPSAAPEAPGADLGWSARSHPQAGEDPSLPLAGVRLLDLTQAWIGPYAAMLLADLGAETIKVESHRRPDVWRQWSAAPVPLAHVRADEVNASPNYNSVNCNKRSLCLDLKSEAGRDILLRLARQADVVMENYTPRVLERLGLDYAAFATVNPGVVMTSFCGFGKTGPWSDYKANGTTIEAIAGWDHFHRYADGRPMVMGFYQADAITGLQMAAATLVALVHSLRTGEGQAIDGSMYEAAAGYIGEAILEAQFGEAQTPFGNRDADFAPSGVFRCAGEDAWIALTVLDDSQWRALATLEPTLDEPRFATAAGRLAATAELEDRLGVWTAGQDAEALAERLRAAGVAAERVRATAELLTCPQLAGRGWFRRLSHADVGEHDYNGPPWRFLGVAPQPHRASPRLGEHSREILKERLGLTDADIDRLEADDVTGAVLAKAPAPQLTETP